MASCGAAFPPGAVLCSSCCPFPVLQVPPRAFVPGSLAAKASWLSPGARFGSSGPEEARYVIKQIGPLLPQAAPGALHRHRSCSARPFHSQPWLLYIFFFLLGLLRNQALNAASRPGNPAGSVPAWDRSATTQSPRAGDLRAAPSTNLFSPLGGTQWPRAACRGSPGSNSGLNAPKVTCGRHLEETARLKPSCLCPSAAKTP